MSRIISLTFLIVFCSFASHQSLGQEFVVSGQIKDANQQPIPNATIHVVPKSKGTVSDLDGAFKLRLSSGDYTLRVSHINFESQERQINVSANVEVDFTLTEKENVLKDVQVQSEAYEIQADPQLIRISPKNLQAMPSATGDFNKILATLPGVASNNELSSVYSVRGGNYDENLVYVNGIKIYRPQIISAGRQEGLSFINPDMVGSINFSAGAWRARYGDKLSSVLDVEYKSPIRHEGVINMSLLGGSLYYGGVNDKQDLSFTFGARHKNTRYLLGTLDVEGEYFPRFTDFQSYVSKRLSNRTKIGVLGSVAINSYETIPGLRNTEFGTIQTTNRLTVFHEGREKLDYQTYQLGTVLSHSFTENFLSHLSVSSVYSTERENYELSGNYLLCRVDNNPSSNHFDQCRQRLGFGANYSYGRNKLQAQILNVEQQNEVYIGNDLLEFGMSWDAEHIDDRLSEYEFLDSADYVTDIIPREGMVDIASHKIAAYAQYTMASRDSTHILNLGARVNHWTYSGQTLISPRAQYAWRFGPRKNKLLRIGTGLYQQHPFYRELRNRDGVINPDVKAQSSYHVVAGLDQYLSIWNRPFKLTSDVYYKHLWNLNPFDVDNVKIRYHANNEGSGYAYGADFRIMGEFIPGAESWFSFGYLKTEERLSDEEDYVRRPMDQRLNIAMFFQDHFPNNPSIKVNLSALYGSGLPFGPPSRSEEEAERNDGFRNAFMGDEYLRVDIGFSKLIEFVSPKKIVPGSLWIGLEILNLFGSQNTISYDWFQDYNGSEYAVPNDLSARFLNVRIIATY